MEIRWEKGLVLGGCPNQISDKQDVHGDQKAQ